LRRSCGLAVASRSAPWRYCLGTGGSRSAGRGLRHSAEASRSSPWRSCGLAVASRSAPWRYCLVTGGSRSRKCDCLSATRASRSASRDYSGVAGEVLAAESLEGDVLGLAMQQTAGSSSIPLAGTMFPSLTCSVVIILCFSASMTVSVSVGAEFATVPSILQVNVCACPATAARANRMVMMVCLFIVRFSFISAFPSVSSIRSRSCRNLAIADRRGHDDRLE